MVHKNVAQYRRMPYRRWVDLRIDADTGRVYHVARIVEIPWIEIHGETREEALLKLDEIFDDCILSMIESGDEIPEPEIWPFGYAREETLRLPFPEVEPPRSIPTDAITMVRPAPAVDPFTVLETDRLATTTV